MSIPKSEMQTQSRRDWPDLPDDVTASTLSRLGAIEMLKSAQLVCKTWRKICKDPLTWRTINMKDDYRYVRTEHAEFQKICRHAVNLSCGNLVDINLESYGSNALLKYLGPSGNRRLRLAYCDRITYKGLSRVASKLPLLEDLEISYCQLPRQPLKMVGRSYPRPKSFKLKQYLHGHTDKCYNDALAIAKTMPGLHHLQLVGNMLTDDGLRAILDCCHHLDLRRCFSLKLEGDLGRRCAERIKNLLLPNDLCY